MKMKKYGILNNRFIIYQMLLNKSLAFYSRQSPLMQNLLSKLPKQVQIDVSPGFLSIFFEQTKKAPSYILLKELFQYLKTTPMVKQQFPFIKSQDRFEQNWMTLHLQLLKSRFVEEKNRSDAINEMQLQTFNYNAQTYFFGEYSKHVHPHMPTKNFVQHFSEAYLKKYRLFELTFQVNYEEKPTEEVLQELLRKMIYEGRVGPKDAELLKLSKYYVAHRRYLNMLEWQDLLQWKIKWGFEQDRGLLQHLSK